MLKRNIWSLFVLLTIMHFFVFAVGQRDIFLRPYPAEFFSDLYSQSQYVIGEASEGGIGDDGLYAFAGDYYIHGGDVSQVNFENPPLGKYMIGLSEIIFNNELVINLIYASILLVFIYKLSVILLKDQALASIATFLFSTDKLVLNQYIYSLLDLPVTLFFIAGIYFLIEGYRKTKKYFYSLSALLFAISFSVKFFPVLPILLLIIVGYLIFKKLPNVYIPFTVSLIILFPLVYLLSHISYFFLSGDFVSFIKYQYWILNWRADNPAVFGNMVTNLITGYYREWWSGMSTWIRSNDWNLLTSMYFILGLVGFWLWRKKDLNNIVSITSFVFVVYISVLTVGFTKYVLPIYPFLVMGFVFTVSSFLRQIKLRNSNKP